LSIEHLSWFIAEVRLVFALFCGALLPGIADRHRSGSQWEIANAQYPMLNDDTTRKIDLRRLVRNSGSHTGVANGLATPA